MTDKPEEQNVIACQCACHRAGRPQSNHCDRCRDKPEEQKVKTLGARLFELVEADQGHAYISDAVEREADDDVLKIAWTAARYHERAARKLRKFIELETDILARRRIYPRSRT